MNDETMREDVPEALRKWEADYADKYLAPYNREDVKRILHDWRESVKNTRAQASAPEGENDRLREMAEHIAASSFPSDDSRLEIAYAIARHLKLDGWPCAYETASGEHIGVGVDVTEDGAWVSVRVGGKLMYSQLHNTFYTRSNAKAGEVRDAELRLIDQLPDSDQLTEQDWAKVSPSVAFHFIERHADDWNHAGQLMEAWRRAVNATYFAQSADPTHDKTKA